MTCLRSTEVLHHCDLNPLSTQITPFSGLNTGQTEANPKTASKSLIFARMMWTDGLVAQWTRARGFGPRCRGFESLLARSLWGEFLSLTRFILTFLSSLQ